MDHGKLLGHMRHIGWFVSFFLVAELVSDRAVGFDQQTI